MIVHSSNAHFRLGVIGDLHTHWDRVDVNQFAGTEYDLLYFTGDLGGGTSESCLRMAREMAGLHHPTLVMPGNNDTVDIEHLGPLMENHPRFPQRVNAGFMQVLSEQEIRLRVFERGVGETLACGTGACAAAVYGLSRQWLRDTVTVHLPGGKLSIAWAGPGEPVVMTGPTAVVFEGTIRI